MKFFLLWLGGGLGTLGRYLISLYCYRFFGDRFPWGTWWVNLLGCFIIGILFGVFHTAKLSLNWRLFWMVGVLGGFTTFSTFGLDFWRMMNEQSGWIAWIYMVTSVGLGLGLVWVGMKIGSS